jgi:hypothetical protein
MIRNTGVMSGEMVEWFTGVEGARPGKPAIGLSIVKRVLGMHGFGYGVEVRNGVTEVWFRMLVVG